MLVAGPTNLFRIRSAAEHRACSSADSSRCRSAVDATSAHAFFQRLSPATQRFGGKPSRHGHPLTPPSGASADGSPGNEFSPQHAPAGFKYPPRSTQPLPGLMPNAEARSTSSSVSSHDGAPTNKENFALGINSIPQQKDMPTPVTMPAGTPAETVALLGLNLGESVVAPSEATSPSHPLSPKFSRWSFANTPTH